MQAWNVVKITKEDHPHVGTAGTVRSVTRAEGADTDTVRVALDATNGVEEDFAPADLQIIA